MIFKKGLSELVVWLSAWLDVVDYTLAELSKKKKKKKKNLITKKMQNREIGLLKVYPGKLNFNFLMLMLM